MTTTIKIHSSDLNLQFVKELQEKYSDSTIEVNISDVNVSPSLLEEQLFWDIIALLDWTQINNDDILAPAIQGLAALPVHYIYLFQDILSEKLFLLDAKKYALHIGEDRWQEGYYFSVDNFLYARCCVVANGKDAYETILNQPAEMPKNVIFEPLLSLASKAYQLKTKKTFNYTGHYNFETYANENGWTD